MKQFLFLISLAVSISHVLAQGIENSGSMELRYGKTLSIGSYVSLNYHHSTSTVFDISAATFLQVSQARGLNYHSYGIDLSADYITSLGDKTEHRFECKPMIGVTAMIDNENLIYKALPFSGRLNYGLLAGGILEWCMSPSIVFTFFLQQKLLFNKTLASGMFTTGLGIRVNLD